MHKSNLFFRQKVSESELDSIFEWIEVAIDRIYEDLGTIGIIYGADVTAKTPTATWHVDVSAGLVIDQLGQRVRWTTIQDVDMSVDEKGVSTAVSGPGLDKWLSLFAEFKRVESVPRVDGNQATVYYDQAEGFQLNVVQGGEAATGTAVEPSLRTDQVLLVDVLIDNNTPSSGIENQDIEPVSHTSRRQWAIQASSASVTINRGQLEDALQDLADAIEAADTALAAHKASVSPGAEHNAIAVAYADSPDWADGNPMTSTNVEAAIDEVVTSLADKILISADGAARVGAEARSFGDSALAQGSIGSQLVGLTKLLDLGFRRLRALNYRKYVLTDTSPWANGDVITKIIWDPLGKNFVAVGYNATTPASSGEISRSATLVTWVTCTLSGGTPEIFNDVIYTSDAAFASHRFIAVGQEDAGPITDAAIYTTTLPSAAWTKQTTSTLGIKTINAICYDEDSGYMIVVGDDGAGVGKAARSANGTTWTDCTVPGGIGELLDVTSDEYGNIVAVGKDTGSGGKIILSTNGGSSFSDEASDAGAWFTGVVWEPNTDYFFACTASGGVGEVYRSTDSGDSWGAILPITYQREDFSGMETDGKGMVVAWGSNTIALLPHALDGSTEAYWRWGHLAYVESTLMDHAMSFVRDTFFLPTNEGGSSLPGLLISLDLYGYVF